MGVESGNTRGGDADIDAAIWGRRGVLGSDDARFHCVDDGPDVARVGAMLDWANSPISSSQLPYWVSLFGSKFMWGGMSYIEVWGWGKDGVGAVLGSFDGVSHRLRVCCPEN